MDPLVCALCVFMVLTCALLFSFGNNTSYDMKITRDTGSQEQRLKSVLNFVTPFQRDYYFLSSDFTCTCHSTKASYLLSGPTDTTACKSHLSAVNRGKSQICIKAWLKCEFWSSLHDLLSPLDHGVMYKTAEAPVNFTLQMQGCMGAGSEHPKLLLTFCRKESHSSTLLVMFVAANYISVLCLCCPGA